MAVASVVVAVAAVLVAIEVRGQEPQAAPDNTASNAAILAALQSLAADRGAAAAPVADGAPAGEEPAAGTDVPAAAPGAAPVAGSAPAPDGAAPESGPATPTAQAPAAEPARSAPSVPVPSAAELTGTLHSAVDPANGIGYRQTYVERGEEATGVLEQIGGRAGTMLQVVKPRVIDPIDMDGNTASGRLQVTFAGAPGPETPLRLTFVYLDGMWKLSARSVCDVASFNGFSCPSGYVR
ncbi:hypothetical protein [Rhodococcus yananensis]|uniref:hypothetical protein n=1 Tax=Rhodococcus yananensis TaxID=2879464 RepID=UPI003EB8A40D